MRGISSNARKKINKGLADLTSSRGHILKIADDIFELSGENALDDRSAAIVFASYVETALEIAIRTHFVDDPETNKRLFSYGNGEGFLAGFAAKISMAEALGVFEKRMYQDLSLIKNIRNAFAHSGVEVTFATSEISAACAAFNLRATWAFFNGKRVEIDSPRKDFAFACNAAFFYLIRADQSPLRYRNEKDYLYRRRDDLTAPLEQDEGPDQP
jgi:DNA-binding MltR family transcriptional regulator